MLVGSKCWLTGTPDHELLARTLDDEIEFKETSGELTHERAVCAGDGVAGRTQQVIAAVRLSKHFAWMGGSPQRVNGRMAARETPGLGVTPKLDVPGDPVGSY